MEDTLTIGSNVFYISYEEPPVDTTVYMADVNPMNIHEAIRNCFANISQRNVTFVAAEAPPELGTFGHFYYRLVNGEVSILSCASKAKGNITIPASIKGMPVTRIEEKAFSGCTKITELSLPDTLVYIGDGAFTDLVSAKALYIPASVTHIGEYSMPTYLEKLAVSKDNPVYCAQDSVLFSKDMSVLYSYSRFDNDTEVVYAVPATVKRIAPYAFSTTAVTKVYLPEGLTTIDNYAFYNASRLSSIWIPPTTTSIGDYAFHNSGLCYADIPASVTRIGKCAFQNCTKLLDIFFAHTRENALTIGWDAFNIRDYLRGTSPLLTIVYVPDAAPLQLHPAISQYSWSNAYRDVTYRTDAVTYYTVTYHLDGGENSPVNRTRYSSRESIYLENPRKAGYSFGGWYDNPDFAGEPVTEVQNGNVSDLYAKWSSVTYNIQFNANKGTGKMPGITGCVTDEDYALPLSTFTRKGYHFGSWNTLADGTGVDYADGATVRNLSSKDGTVTLYAHWADNLYTIQFLGNGADQGDTAAQTVRYSQNFVLPENGFARTGYAFTGWNTQANGKGTAYKDGATVVKLTSVHNGTITLYAQWAPAKYTVRFAGNGATKGSIKPQTHTYGKSLALTANAFSRTGYSFTGWNTAPDGSGTAYGNKAKVKNLAEKNGAAVTLYAQWTPVQYQITYKNIRPTDLNENPTTFTIESDTIVFADPVREGFTFNGWYTSSKFSSKTAITRVSAGTAKNLTVYAKWKAHRYTIGFDGNGATSGSMKALTGRQYGSRYTLPANSFKRTGYTFTGWNTAPDGSGTAYTNKAKVMNLTAENGGSIILYAQWTPTVYKLTYKNLTAKEIAALPDRYTIETSVTLPVLSRVGYTFGGWYTSSKMTEKTRIDVINPDLNATGNRTIYAKWTANKYTVVFDSNAADLGSIPTGKMNPMTKRVYGKTFALSPCSFKLAGYTFAGWNTAADGSGTAYKNKAKVSNLCQEDGGTVTLYAQWTPRHP